MVRKVNKEGTIAFRLQHRHRNWATNDDGYDFGTIRASGIQASAKKTSDKRLEFEFDGPLKQRFHFRVPVPDGDPRMIAVMASWKGKKLKLYLDGKHVHTARASPLL